MTTANQLTPVFSPVAAALEAARVFACRLLTYCLIDGGVDLMHVLLPESEWLEAEADDLPVTPFVFTPPNETGRTITNPVQGDRVTFLQTSLETGNALTQVDVEMAPGGGGRLHYNRSYSKRFVCLEGEMGLQIGKNQTTLRAGESAHIERGTIHCFTNPTVRPVRFLMEIAPGSRGFEHSLHIAYGLARDNQVRASGLPKNPFIWALLLEMSDTRLGGPLALLGPLTGLLARIARRHGLYDTLLVRYAPHTIREIAEITEAKCP